MSAPQASVAMIGLTQGQFVWLALTTNPVNAVRQKGCSFFYFEDPMSYVCMLMATQCAQIGVMFVPLGMGLSG